MVEKAVAKITSRMLLTRLGLRVSRAWEKLPQLMDGGNCHEWGRLMSAGNFRAVIKAM